jgi:hypothetical protein
MTDRLIKKLTFDQQQEWHNKNNWSIFQSVLVANGATTYKYPMSDLAGLDEKLSFSGNISEPWQQIGQDIDGEAEGDYFGSSVSMSADGSVMAVGAIRNNGIGLDSGHVCVYEYKENLWQQKGAHIDGEAEMNESGWSISLSADGSILAIGAPKNLENGSNSGHVRVYEYRQYNNLNDNNKFHHTSTSSQTKPLIITEDFNTGPENGQFYWTQLGLDIDGEAEGDFSGVSVSLSADGSTVAIGATSPLVQGSETGHVRVYRSNPDKLTAVTDQTSPNFGPKGWDRIGGDIDGEAGGDRSGWSVSLSGDGSIVAIGAPNNDGNGVDSGHVRIYQHAPNKTEADEDGPIGWSILGRDIDGEEANYRSGAAVSLSSDGSTLAIGGPTYNNVDSDDTPRVRVYKFTGWGLGT